MLVLTRRLNEEISIMDKDGNLIAKVALVQVKGKQARIGVKADQDYTILRTELVSKIAKKGNKALTTIQ